MKKLSWSLIGLIAACVLTIVVWIAGCYGMCFLFNMVADILGLDLIWRVLLTMLWVAIFGFAALAAYACCTVGKDSDYMDDYLWTDEEVYGVN